MKGKDILNNMPALFVSVVWGSTFVVSKSILDAGITPLTLITIRFILAYVALCIVCPKPYKFSWSKTEFLLVLVSLSGGSLYYYIEYSALKLTTATNVGLISATVPILSSLFCVMMGMLRMTKGLAVGSAIAMAGVFAVVTNGNMDLLELHPAGDLLSMLSASIWAVYTVAFGLLPEEVSSFQATRRLFFYASVTILPFTLMEASEMPVIEQLRLFSLGGACGAAYLGLVANGVSFWLWNVSMRLIGPAQTNNYLYLLPVVSFAACVLIGGEDFTAWCAVGTVLITIGIIIADKGVRMINKEDSGKEVIIKGKE